MSARYYVLLTYFRRSTSDILIFCLLTSHARVPSTLFSAFDVRVNFNLIFPPSSLSPTPSFSLVISPSLSPTLCSSTGITLATPLISLSHFTRSCNQDRQLFSLAFVASLSHFLVLQHYCHTPTCFAGTASLDVFLSSSRQSWLVKCFSKTVVREVFRCASQSFTLPLIHTHTRTNFKIHTHTHKL